MCFRADVGKLVACLVLINPILTQGGNDKKYRYRALLLCNKKEKNVNPFPKSIVGQSLAPAAVVTPAPMTYFKDVAINKLVIGFLLRTSGPPCGLASGLALAFS